MPASLQCLPTLGRVLARVIGFGIAAQLALPSAGAQNDDVGQSYLRAQKALAEGDAEGALRRFQLLAKRNPRTPWSAPALWNIARIHEHLGDWEAAFETLRSLIENEPGHFEKAHAEQFRLAQRLLGTGQGARRTLEVARPSARVDPEVIAAMLQSIIRHGPHSAVGIQAHYYLAAATEKAGKKGEAVALYEDFVETYPQHELADDASYQMAYISYKDWQAREGASPRHRERAAVALAYFLARFPHSDKAAQARSCLSEVRSAELRELRSLARYYASRGNAKAAEIYYEQLAMKFPEVVLRDEELRREITQLPKAPEAQ